MRKRYGRRPRCTTLFPVVAQGKGHGSDGYGKITMEVAVSDRQFDKITVVQIGVEVVDADHLPPIIQEIEMKDQFVDTRIAVSPEPQTFN